MIIVLSDLPPDFRELVVEMLRRGINCRQIPRTIIIEAIHHSVRHLLVHNAFPKIPHHYIQLIDNQDHFRRVLCANKLNTICLKKNELPGALAYQFIYFNDGIKWVLNVDRNKNKLQNSVEPEQVHQGYWDLIKKIKALFPKMPYFVLNLLSTDFTLAPQSHHTVILGSSVSLALKAIKDLDINLASHLVDILFPDS
jgi:hypothetical protein